MKPQDDKINEVEAAAKAFIEGAAALGWTLGEQISRSENRIGGYSLYFSISKKANGRTKFATCRFSDHCTNNGTHMIGWSVGANVTDLLDKLAKS